MALITVKEDAMAVDKDRIEGSATNLGGKVKEGAGKLTGDEKRWFGLFEQRSGLG